MLETDLPRRLAKRTGPSFINDFDFQKGLCYIRVSFGASAETRRIEV
jgi:hypothetical protein